LPVAVIYTTLFIYSK